MSLILAGIVGMTLLMLAAVVMTAVSGSRAPRRNSLTQVDLMLAARPEPKRENRDDEDEADDPETLIQHEISRRLDALQGHRAMFMAQDRNNDGRVDEEEWAAVRKTIEEEVRAEMSGADGSVEGSGSAPSPEAPDEPPEGTDGSW